MQILAKIVKTIRKDSGTSKAGKAWKIREVEVQTAGDAYPQTYCLKFFNDSIDLLKGKDTKTVYEFFINVKGRKSDYKAKTYYNTDLEPWKIETAVAEQKAAVNASTPLNVSDLEDDDDLPF